MTFSAVIALVLVVPVAVGAALTLTELAPKRLGTMGGYLAEHRNLRGAFLVAPAHAQQVAGRDVALVDDVLTTGATVDACVRTLEQGGARHVDVLTLARVVRPAV